MNSGRGSRQGANKFLRDSGRACGGALIFSLPLLMTMEMWTAGFTIDRLRFALLLVLSVPMLTELSHQIGFEQTVRWRDDLFDAIFALGIGAICSAIMLASFGVLEMGMPLEEIVGKIAIQSLPAAMGALLARTLLGERSPDDIRKEETYLGELFLMATGALFLGLNLAPTEEMMLISYLLTPWHALVLMFLSLAVMYGFVFAVGFSGGRELGPGTTIWSAFLRFAVPGYIISLAISIYILWTLGRFDGMSISQAVLVVIVLGFPASLGAAAARLIL